MNFNLGGGSGIQELYDFRWKLSSAANFFYELFFIYLVNQTITILIPIFDILSYYTIFCTNTDTYLYIQFFLFFQVVVVVVVIDLAINISYATVPYLIDSGSSRSTSSVCTIMQEHEW